MMPSVDILIQQAQLAEREGRRDDARSLFERALYSLRRGEDGKLASSLLRWIGAHVSDRRRHRRRARLPRGGDRRRRARAATPASIGHAINVAGDRAPAARRPRQRRSAVSDRARARDRRRRDALAAMTALNLGVIARRARRSREDAALLSHEPRRIPHARRAEGSARRAQQHGHAVHGPRALGRRGARVRGGGADRRRARRHSGAHSARSEPRRARDRARRFRRGARRMRARDVAVGADAGRLRARRDRRSISARSRASSASCPAAEEHLERAQQIAVERRDLLLSAETAREHAELCRKQGRHRDALHAPQSRPPHLHAAQREARPRRHRSPQRRVSSATSSRSCAHWSGSIESKDRYTQGHCERVADLACALALRAGLEPRELFWFRIGAIVHDVGKLIIPSEVLNKPGKLAPDEWELVKRHPVAGVEMLADMDFPGDVIPMVRSHHERWDGQGYPGRARGRGDSAQRAHPLHRRRLRRADVEAQLQGRAVARRGDGASCARTSAAVRSGAVRAVRGPDEDARAVAAPARGASKHSRPIARAACASSASPARRTISPAC